MSGDRLSPSLSRTTWLLLLFLTGCLFVSNARDDTGWAPEDYPDPIRAPELCGRVNWTASFVCDPDGILTATEAYHLDKELVSTIRDTPCPCESCAGEYDGYNIAVALMKRMSPGDPAGSSLRVRAQGFAMYLRAVAWDYGRCNEGVVILVSTEDRQIYTATGATAREKLTDDIVDNIYAESREYFTAGRWAEGLTEMVTRYKKVFSGGSSSTSAAVIGSMFGVVGLCGIGVFSDHLDLLLFTTLRDTPCPCDSCPGQNDGYNIAVALMKRMSTSGMAASSPRVRAQGFAMYLRAVAWDYGKCDEGVVIFVSTEDRQIYTATGATARQKLIDATVDNIYMETRKYFTAGRWAEGLADMVTRYKNVLEGGSSSATAAVIGCVLGVVGFFTICICCIKCRMCDCGGGGSGTTSSYHHHEHWYHTSHNSGGYYDGGGF
ncbi:Hypp5671 [Branchiostoma lanceolatum]|uniref:Hypp5671 protein n=1 Tax=Branchiostoma lanceolatum TaxID=7740 RepID=A0A8J9YQT4_BRALA|nr:Hypp5671 [Branchiostoma lanceolatum]